MFCSGIFKNNNRYSYMHEGKLRLPWIKSTFDEIRDQMIVYLEKGNDFKCDRSLLHAKVPSIIPQLGSSIKTKRKYCTYKENNNRKCFNLKKTIRMK